MVADDIGKRLRVQSKEWRTQPWLQVTAIGKRLRVQSKGWRTQPWLQVTDIGKRLSVQSNEEIFLYFSIYKLMSDIHHGRRKKI